MFEPGVDLAIVGRTCLGPYRVCKINESGDEILWILFVDQYQDDA